MPSDELGRSPVSGSIPVHVLTSASLGTLQGLIGNRAVDHLVGHGRTASRNHQSARRPAVQRQVTYTPGAGGGAGTFSAVNLDAEENGPGEGHTLSRHVNISDQELRARLADPNIRVATRWASRADAEATIAAALVAREAEIGAWLAGGAATRAQAVAGAAAALAAITRQLTLFEPPGIKDLTVALAAAGLKGEAYGRTRSALVGALGAIRGDAARAPNPGNAAKIGESVRTARTKIAELTTMLVPVTAPKQQAVDQLQALLAPLQEIEREAAQWATHLEAGTRVLVQEVRYAANVSGVTVARSPTQVDVTSVPEVSMYLYFIDGTHFQIRTAFPGSPTSVPAART